MQHKIVYFFGNQALEGNGSFCCKIQDLENITLPSPWTDDPPSAGRARGFAAGGQTTF